MKILWACYLQNISTHHPLFAVHTKPGLSEKNLEQLEPLSNISFGVCPVITHYKLLENKWYYVLHSTKMLLSL